MKFHFPTDFNKDGKFWEKPVLGVDLALPDSKSRSVVTIFSPTGPYTAAISNSPPPNYKELQEAFPKASFEKGMVYVYAPYIHTKYDMEKDLQVHEMVHIKQQRLIGGPEIWWKRYIEEPKFRLEQELEAYVEQYKYILKTQPKSKHSYYLRLFAHGLTVFYDTGIGYLEATARIKHSNLNK